MGLDEFLGPLSSPAKDRATHFIAMAQNEGWVQYGRAIAAATKVIKTRQPLSEMENAGLLVRIAKIYQEQKEMKARDADPSEFAVLQEELDQLTKATVIAGNTWSKQGSSRQWLIGGANLNFEILPFVAGVKKRAATGKDLTAAEKKFFEDAQKEHEKIVKDLLKKNKEQDERYAQLVAEKIAEESNETKEDLWTKFGDLLAKGCDVNG